MSSSGEMIFDARMDASGFQKDASSLGNIVKGLGVFEVIKKGMSMVAQSIDAAVSRYDTLSRFSPIMQKMGYSAEDADASIKKLSDGIQGLPTTLDAIVNNTKQLAIATGSLDKGTNSALALNNAFLASGASAEDASRGTTQYIQALSSGKMQQQEWMTLTQTMTYALQEVAKAFGYTGTDAVQQLGAALKGGEITMQQFNDKLIELDGGIGGFAEVAKTATGGIGTAMTNLKSRTVIGVTSIIEAIDRGFSKTRFKSIENIINTTSTGIKNGLQSVAKVAEFTAENFEVLAPIVLGTAAAFKAYSIVGTVSASFKGLQAAIQAANAILIANKTLTGANLATQTMMSAALASETTAELVRAAAKKAGMTVDAAGNLVKASGVAATTAETVAVLASSGAITAKTVLVGVLTGSIGLATAAQWLWNSAMLANPIGLVIAGIVALIAIVAAVIAIFNKSNAAYNEQKKELKELSKEHENYASELEDSKRAASEEAQAKVVQAQRNRDLMNSLAELTDENGKYSGSAEEAQLAVNELNSSIDGLGLAFDETTGQLNMSAKELKAYGENLEAVTKYEAAQSEYNNILEERNSLQAKINALEEKKKIYNKMAEEGAITQKQANQLTKDAEKLIKEYGDSMSDLEIEVEAYGRAVTESYNKEAQIAVRRQEMLNTQGNQIEEFARKYHLSAEQIVEEASKMEGGLAQWGTEAEKTYAAVLVAEEDYVEQIKAGNVEIDESYAQSLEARRLNGEELNNIEAAYLEQWKSINQEAVEHYKGQQQEIVAAAKGTKEAIVLSEQQSAAERLEIQRKNNEATAQYVENYNSIWGKIPAEHRQHLSEMTIEDARFLQEIASTWDTGGQEQWNQYVEGIQAGIATSEQLVQGSAAEYGTGIVNATGDAITGAAGTLETAGGNMGDNVMTGTASAIQSGSAQVNSAVQGMSTQVQNQFKQMSTTATTTVTQMMTSVVSGITTRQGAAKSAAQGVATGVITEFESMKNKAKTVVEQMMTAVVNAIKDGTAAAKAAASGVVDAIIAAIKAKDTDAYNAGKSIGQQMTNGMVAGLEAGKGAVYAKAEEIANAAAKKIKDALEVKSPSRVMEDIFNNVVLGMILGMEDEENGLFRAVDALAEGVVERLRIIPEGMAAALNQKLRMAIVANQTAFANVPAVATAGAGIVNNTTNIYFEQTNISPDAASPGENSRAAEAMLRRAKYQIK